MHVDRHTGRFRIMGYRFRLVPDAPHGIPLLRVMSDDGQWGFALATVWTEGEDNGRPYYVASAMGVERDHTDLYVAVGQVLCDTI